MAFGRHKTIQKIKDRLLQSGWQSWSTSTRKNFFSPLFNFSPHPKNLSSKPKIRLSQELKKPAYGWCSWYSHGLKITEEKILKQTSWLAKHKKTYQLPIDYILIDDGWCTWGDWQEEDLRKFPNGLKATSQQIKSLSLKSGIWLTPFLVHPKSNIALKHPEWLVKKNGKLVEGLNLTFWDRFLPYKKWLLDIQNPEVLKYLDKCLGYLVKDCHFHLIKIDFLYANHFNPNITGETADSFLREYLTKIRQRYPHVYIIACGCPLIPAAGVVDSMRIGPDTKVISPFLKFIDNPFFNRWYLSSQVLPSIVKKLWTRKIWHVDPDAYLCRESLGYTHNQLKKFQKLIRVGRGNIFLGDDLTKLPKNRIKKYLYPLFDSL